MTDTETITSTSTKLRVLADLIDAHPDLPQPYTTAYSSGEVEARWYLHINDLQDDLPGQKTTAAQIVSTLGGKWDKRESPFDSTRYEFSQSRDGLSLEVTVNRAAMCERVVVGSHEVTVPATPAIPKQAARPERTETVEDVTWICSSLLSPVDVAS